MKRRAKMTRSKSRKVFKRNAVKRQSLNNRATPMRGGFRI